MRALLGTVAIVSLFLTLIVKGDNNGKALTPPMGWRSWNAFYASINSSIIEAQINELVQPRDASGNPDASSTESLLSLGFESIGIDEGDTDPYFSLKHTENYVTMLSESNETRDWCRLGGVWQGRQWHSA